MFGSFRDFLDRRVARLGLLAEAAGRQVRPVPDLDRAASVETEWAPFHSLDQVQTGSARRRPDAEPSHRRADENQ